MSVQTHGPACLRSGCFPKLVSSLTDTKETPVTFEDTSLFHGLAFLGWFTEYGFVLILSGIALVIVSIVVPWRQ